ncbi:MAG TPA: ABC transporter permease [Parafilimonas sp.]|nr:ABC transporter permease [Parafilimonas sp.]
MYKNYFKTAWRNIRKNRLFSFINILGLSIGIATCFIIMLYVQDELSYDRFNEKADRIYRIAFKANIDGGKILEGNVMPPVAAALKNDYPEVEEATRLNLNGDTKITYNNKTFKESRLAIVDSNFFSVFSLPFIEGNSKTALIDPHNIVLTKDMAHKYFNTEEPIGKLLKIDNESFKITGVIDNIPSNCHFHFDFFVPLSDLPYARDPSWLSSGMFTYIVLKKGYDYKKLEAKFPGMVEKYMGPQIQQQMGLSLAQFRTKGNELGFILQPLTSIHLYSNTNFELEPGGNASYVYIFGVIAIFMLAVACINFINLSTASASKRAKEVGVRKVAGSGKLQLISQFLSESILITLFALIISLVLIQVVLPAFNNISGKHLSLNIKPLLAFIGLGLSVGVIAGIYPAFYLSSFKPIAVLKGKLTSNNKSFGLRSSLVVFQFFISVGLIISTIVVYQQMKFIQNKKLGYDKEQLLTLPNSYVLGKNEQVYKQQMLKDPRIVSATVSFYKPAGPTNGNNTLVYPEGHDNEITKTVCYHIDEQYVPTFGMQMAAGRNFSPAFPTDSLAMIINETAAKAFGWNTNTAIGKTIVGVNSDRGKNVPYHVVGVVKDFNFKSLHEPITPLLMTLEPEGGVIFKIKTTDVAGLLATMKKQWDAFKTDEPFTYSFIDDLYNKTYSTEQKTGTILNIFSVLTIFVACLGLFGLVTYTAEQRTKEIGIRKVLGASVSQLTKMLSKEFIRLVLIASLIAFPVAWWAMNKWLQSFAYRININWWVFAIAGAAALLIALITISFQSIKAAIANPVRSLRTE